jgi:predicted homoserine dehydrogenase-like protein
MQSILLKQLHQREQQVEVIVVGLGFMGFGFISVAQHIQGVQVALLISRRPEAALNYLQNKGLKAKIVKKVGQIKKNVSQGVISVSDNLNFITEYDNQIVIEMTGTVAYATQVALETLAAGKHLITMNPEVQATTGSALLKLFNDKNLVITDVLGDQPGSLTRLIGAVRLKGFNVKLAGNMKRYLDRHATQKQMQPWADDKGLAVRQTVSFTDGTKQAIEMTLVGNFYGMSLDQVNMKGPRVDHIHNVLTKFDWQKIPEEGVVDYVIGKDLFPGVFVVVEHPDPNQQKYLRYLSLGEGPQYVLFDSYHLCHLEVAETVAKVALYQEATIHNNLKPKLQTLAVAKQDLAAGTKLDGIGGDTVYGQINYSQDCQACLPIGLAKDAVLKKNLKKDQVIELGDVELADNQATRLLGLV